MRPISLPAVSQKPQAVDSSLTGWGYLLVWQVENPPEKKTRWEAPWEPNGQLRPNAETWTPLCSSRAMGSGCRRRSASVPIARSNQRVWSTPWPIVSITAFGAELRNESVAGFCVIGGCRDSSRSITDYSETPSQTTTCSSASFGRRLPVRRLSTQTTRSVTVTRKPKAVPTILMMSMIMAYPCIPTSYRFGLCGVPALPMTP